MVSVAINVLLFVSEDEAERTYEPRPCREKSEPGMEQNREISKQSRISTPSLSERADLPSLLRTSAS